MARHRSLSNALTPEKLAFIKGSEIKPSESEGSTELPIQTIAKVVPVVHLPDDSQTPAESHPASDGQLSTKKAHANDDYLVPLTSRIQARTSHALRCAHLEQKLNRREPATQQEIVEIALQQWLRENHFLD